LMAWAPRASADVGMGGSMRLVIGQGTTYSA